MPSGDHTDPKGDPATDPAADPAVIRAHPDASHTYTIGELAAEFGLTLRAIRHYEDEGLLTPTRHGVARLYSRRERGRLALICRGKRLGFSLNEIREFLSLYDADPAQLEQMRFLRRAARDRIGELTGRLHDVRLTLDELRDIEREIGRHLSAHGVPDDE